jgi:hypothetical protein
MAPPMPTQSSGTPAPLVAHTSNAAPDGSFNLGAAYTQGATFFTTTNPIREGAMHLSAARMATFTAIPAAQAQVQTQGSAQAQRPLLPRATSAPVPVPQTMWITMNVPMTVTVQLRAVPQNRAPQGQPFGA